MQNKEKQYQYFQIFFHFAKSNEKQKAAPDIPLRHRSYCNKNYWKSKEKTVVFSPSPQLERGTSRKERSFFPTGTA